MRYFGEPWPSGICDEGEQMDTPLDVPCILCMEPIMEGDQGTEYVNGPVAHRECGFRAVMGGIGHHVDHVRYCHGELGTDAGLPKRLSAQLVWRLLAEDIPVDEEELEELRAERLL